MLSFISSYLGSHPQAATQPQLAQSALPLEGSGSLAGPSSGALALRTDARLWEVQWEELTIQSLIGHGSFGSVYLAEWHRTSVAVKVLIGKGEHVVQAGQSAINEVH